MDNLSTACTQDEPVFNMEIFEKARAEIKKIESEPLLVGIIINKGMYKKLMSISVEREIPAGVPALGFVSGVQIGMMKYQRGIRIFYKSEIFNKHLLLCDKI